ncbi:chemosensory receptor a [Plakobranchus ocellatus]|uniref:Chemosensory receptor a n=1 Tax=Plakobranchus ocellatus TaxID=259542 RepID=A0AAV3YB02_9GAST|nr:chemosensory receptor a [Plakobranchus ocellatus]
MVYTTVKATTESTGFFDSPTTMNASVVMEKGMELVTAISPILSFQDFIILMSLIAYAILLVAFIGIVSNLLVIITCNKIGFSETINISYLALGISDLMASVIRCYGSILFLFDAMNTDLPFNPTSISVTTGFWPGQGFEKTTAFITASIALERCLCVQFPLHAKKIVTKRKTILSNVIIYIFAFVPSNLIHIVYRFKWVFNPARNRTILTNVCFETPLRYIISRALYAYYGTILHFTALIVVWTCTIFLAVGLKRKTVTKNENFKHSIVKEDKQKDLRLIKTVFLLAATYLACSTPTAATLLVPHFVS